jgi:hypothetical protein
VNAPRWPVYVISKGRAENGLTAKFLIADGVPFKLVVEPQEFDAYAKQFGAERVLVLPFSNLGLGGIPARNWCWEHAKAAGAERHWILDDNIRYLIRMFRGQRIRCDAGTAFCVVEDFVDRYTNVAIAGMNYSMFGVSTSLPPYQLNCHVYSCLLIDNALPQRWRGRYNEDTDLCLQVLSAGLCTVLVNAFMIYKMRTMTMKGGNAADLYRGDGRLRMARSLERVWPYVVTTGRRFKRPQHIVRDAWRTFDTPLKLKPGIDLAAIAPNDYGLKLEQVGDAVRSEQLRDLLAEQKGLDEGRAAT